MTNIEISKVQIGEIAQLQQIARQTFTETFSAFNSEENMKNYLEEGLSIEKLTSEFQDQEAAFYFAIENEKCIGYLKINFGNAQTELKDHTALEIERIYVLQAFHGKGVGQLLYDHAIAIALQKEVQYVWLGVWEQNHRAISFYTKNGFVAFDKHIFKLGDDEQTDIMMKKIM
ncbi:N-acetyltransferase family protein [Flavobacterium sp. TSSA_36]|uniref:GNAT family N-acetyltransferase n=1 Tax=Flavobacterium sp. TSSA_36 TaxID=3447669 RepID=UPI003F2A5BE4